MTGVIATFNDPDDHDGVRARYRYREIGADVISIFYSALVVIERFPLTKMGKPTVESSIE